MKSFYPKLLGLSVFISLFGMHTLQAQSFINPLPIPDTIDVTSDTLTLDVESHNFNPNGGSDTLNTSITTFAFNHSTSTSNTYLGPTLIWHTGRNISIRVQNNLPDTATVHWHGAHVPPYMDGGPHQPIPPNGGVWPVNFTILDSACTLWYHPHAHDETYSQVEMGLSGIIIVDDPTDPIRDALPHRYGIDDFPIIIQERNFIPTGSTPTHAIDTNQHGGGTTIINGVMLPYLNVPPQMVRFRLLDGSSRMSYNLGFSQIASGLLPMTVVGSDGGYLPSPQVVDTIMIGPGIRQEIVFDFTSYAGQTVYLTNVKTTPSTTIIGIGPPEQSAADFFMEIRVDTVQSLPVGSIPSNFPPLNVPPTNSSTRVRKKFLIGSGGPTNPVPFSINGNQFLIDVINDTIPLGATEIWSVYNATNVAHPFHIHDIQFYVTHYEQVTSGSSDTLPIPVEMMGPKDNVLIEAGHRFTFVGVFDDFGVALGPNASDSAYMYHCHILTHEDGYYAPGGGSGPGFRDNHGMMQQFIVHNGLTLTGTHEDPAKNLTFYPNPTSGQLHLRGDSPQGSEVRLFDLQGKLLRAIGFPAFNGDVLIPVDDLARGMILVEYRSANGGHLVQKILLRE